MRKEVAAGKNDQISRFSGLQAPCSISRERKLSVFQEEKPVKGANIVLYMLNLKHL